MHGVSLISHHVDPSDNGIPTRVALSHFRAHYGREFHSKNGDAPPMALLELNFTQQLLLDGWGIFLAGAVCIHG